MANTVNIGGKNDPFYRYKMERLQCKVEGKGNGIKTVLPNIVSIGRSLNRSPAYATKFFGCELGAQTKETGDRFIVNGAHDVEKLTTLLNQFITKFVLCPSCTNPETDLVITKDQTILRDCKACGQRNPVDMRHKLTTYILKNPPPKPNKVPGNSKEVTKEKEGKASKPTSEHNSDDEASAAPKKSKSSSKKSSSASGSATAVDKSGDANEDNDDDDWAEDTSAEAVARRMKELNVADNVKKALAKVGDEEDNDDDDANNNGSGEDPLEEFAAFVTQEAAKDGKPDDARIFNKSTELSIRPDHALAVLVQVVFNENILTQIPRWTVSLQRLMKSPKCPKALIGALERVIGVQHPAILMPRAVAIFKAMYEADILTEEDLIAWGDAKASKKYVDRETDAAIKKKAEPLINWLKTAEEESDEDDEDEEEENDEEEEEEEEEEEGNVKKPVAATAATARPSSAAAKPAAATASSSSSASKGKPASAPKKEEEEDFDIDEI